MTGRPGGAWRSRRPATVFSGFADRGAGRPRRGSALLPSVLALAIVAVVLLGMMAYYLQTLSPPERGAESDLAEAAARAKVEEIRGLTLAALQETYPPGTPVIFVVQGLTPVPPNEQPGTVDVDYSDPVLVRVTVRIRWQGARGERSIPPVAFSLVPRR